MHNDICYFEKNEDTFMAVSLMSHISFCSVSTNTRRRCLEIMCYFTILSGKKRSAFSLESGKILSVQRYCLENQVPKV